jgi:Recombination endonuclease VII
MLTAFQPRGRNNPTPRTSCKQCDAARSRARYAVSPDAGKARSRAWQASNPERKAYLGAAWRAANPEKDRARYRRAKLKRYGLTIGDYDALLTAQGGRCACCGRVETRTRREASDPLVVDHCHQTGRVRGLLCHACNLTAGWAERSDEPETYLDAVKSYLRDHRGILPQ